MPAIKAYKHGEKGAPAFPEEFTILKKAVLQVTDIKTNRNKYYAIELHQATLKGKATFRVFTHYGRTDDLETNPDAGQKENRFFASMPDAEACYTSIYREKTGPRKGYKELSLASSKIGSQKARGSSTGEVDDKTLARIAGAPTAPTASKLPEPVQALVRYLYDEATSALTSTVSATITAKGIETPLGILTLGQIEKGEQVLLDLYRQFQKKKKNRAEMERLSGEFYTLIPHRIGRSRDAVANAVIDSLPLFEQKQETLQLMKDMLQVNGEGGSVLFNARVDDEYAALGCTIEPISPASSQFKDLADHVVSSQVKSEGIEVRNIFAIRRPSEWDGFTKGMDNQRLLFHGSRARNWVGILSRGILLPKIVVSLGVGRTDAGWLGNGIYFGDAACTSAQYASPGKKGTSFLTIARVALGKMKDYSKITYGLNAPPEGYDSCHGVRGTEFDDDEYVIYTTAQQRLEYLVEFTS
jgi:poly [ADP-ribose] polymerase